MTAGSVPDGMSLCIDSFARDSEGRLVIVLSVVDEEDEDDLGEAEDEEPCW